MPGLSIDDLRAILAALPDDLVVVDADAPRFTIVAAPRATAFEGAGLADYLTDPQPSEHAAQAAATGLASGPTTPVLVDGVVRWLVHRVEDDLARARRRQGAELVEVSRELDALRYAVSHDLRAPLRAIDGFARALEEDCGHLLDEHGRDHLARIRGGAARLALLIDALLELSRLARQPVDPQRVDLSALAAEVVGELRAREPAREITVEIAAGLAATGDRALLATALRQLLDNAWKFTRPVAAPRIELGEAAGPSGTAFFVRDNGVGFDASQTPRLFAPFSRLHPQSAFAGLGVGLATVQRVVARHGGVVRAEAGLGGGATFWFTLPRAPA